MSRDEKQTRAELIDPIIFECGWNETLIRTEKTPGGEGSVRLIRELEEACQGATITGLTRNFIENIRIPILENEKEQAALADHLETRMTEIETMCQAALRQLEVISALPAAIMRRTFDVEEPRS